MKDTKVLLILVALYGIMYIVCICNRRNGTSTKSNKLESFSEIAGLKKKVYNGKTTLNITNIILYAKSRTGSTFTATVLQKIPGSFFSFEPFNMVEYKTLPKTGVRLVNQILSCEFKDVYNECLKDRDKQHCDKWSSFAFCNYGDDLRKSNCERSTISQKEAMCEETSVRSTKIVRLRYLEQLSPFLERSDYKIIMLLRDPRAMLQSRFVYKQGIGLKDLPQDNLKNAAKRSCAEIAADIKFLQAYKKADINIINDKILAVRYEDLAMDSLNQAKKIHKFIGLNQSPREVLQWLTDEQHRAQGKISMTFFTEGPRSVYRNNMTATALNWKKKIPLNTVQLIQTNCHEALVLAGYNIIRSQKDLDTDDNNVVSKFIL